MPILRIFWDRYTICSFFRPEIWLFIIIVVIIALAIVYLLENFIEIIDIRGYIIEMIDVTRILLLPII